MDNTNTQEQAAVSQAAAATPSTPESPAPVIHYPNPDNNHSVAELHFGFRTVKDEKTGVETKREAVDVKLPILNFNGLVKVLEDYARTGEVRKALENKETAEKVSPEDQADALNAKRQFDLVMSSVQATYESAIKDFLGDNPEITSVNFPYNQFTWEALANQPESERRGRGIAKEVWDDFIKSYINIMPGATGKKKENIEKQAAILAQKLNPLKNHEDKEKILPNFKTALGVYMNAAGADAETFAGCVQFLLEKADKILSADKNANLAANLGFE